MMKKIVLLITMLNIAYSDSFNLGNPAKKTKAIYFEFLGSGLIYSLNYEQTILKSAGLRFGISYISSTSEENKIRMAVFPLMLSYLYGSSNHKLELGFGVDVFAGRVKLTGDRVSFKFLYADISTGVRNPVDTSGVDFALISAVGYRYQPEDSGLILRLTFTPIFDFSRITPWVGISVGYAF